MRVPSYPQGVVVVALVKGVVVVVVVEVVVMVMVRPGTNSKFTRVKTEQPQ